MTKYILIGGYIHKAPDGGRLFCKELIKNLEHKPIKILDCLFARDRIDWNKRFKDDKNFFENNLEDFKLELALPENFINQVQDSNIVFFQGGVPQKIINSLDSSVNWTKEFKNKVIVGSSGGADTLVKYYGVGKTGNIGEGLGLLPIKFIPHWESFEYGQGLDINWDQLLEKIKLYKEDLNIVTLGDGEFVVFNSEDWV